MTAAARPKFTILDGSQFINAICMGDMKMVLDYFAEVPDALNRREDRDGTPDYALLHHAIHHRQPAMVALLLKKGAEIESEAKFGMRPLMLAARAGDAETVALLLENGADARGRDHSGQTALDYLRQRKKNDPEKQRILSWLTEAFESPTAGRQLKSKAGLAYLAETKRIFGHGVGEVSAPATARFQKRKLNP